MYSDWIFIGELFKSKVEMKFMRTKWEKNCQNKKNKTTWNMCVCFNLRYLHTFFTLFLVECDCCCYCYCFHCWCLFVGASFENSTVLRKLNAIFYRKSRWFYLFALVLCRYWHVRITFISPHLSSLVKYIMSCSAFIFISFQILIKTASACVICALIYGMQKQSLCIERRHKFNHLPAPSAPHRFEW